MLKVLLTLLLPLIYCTSGLAQSEIRWTLNLNTDQSTRTAKAQFQALEDDLLRFLNGQTWTKDRFAEEERIEATVFVTILEQERKSESGGAVAIPDAFKGTLAIQSLRPIYGTGEATPLLNFQDKDLEFTYRQGEGIQYSEQSYISDLGTVMAFYSYIILGLDYDTFSPQGGQPYFDKARELHNRLPNNIQNTSGWTTQTRSKNRFQLLTEILDPRMLPMRRAYYTYHRLGLDMVHKDVVAGRNNMTLAIEDVQKANAANPNTSFVQVFVDAKREEIIEVYKGASGVEQNTIITNMTRIDQSNAGEYRGIRYRATPGRSTSRGRRGAR